MSKINIHQITLDIETDVIGDAVDIGMALAKQYQCQVTFLFDNALVSCNPHEILHDVYANFIRRQEDAKERKRQELHEQLGEIQAQLVLLGDPRIPGMSRKRDQCVRGHPKTPENTNKRSGCMICQRILRKAWRLRNRGFIESTETALLPVELGEK